MNYSRRSFIKNTALLAAGSAIIPGQFIQGSAKLQRVAVQLFSVWGEIYKDTKGTLAKLAKMGYTHVEHAGYKERKFYDYAVKDFKSLLNDLDLKMPSGHTYLGMKHWDNVANDFTDEWKYTVEDAAEMGQRFVLTPSLGSIKYTAEELKPLMELYNKSGEYCKKIGMKFGYHNHDVEFVAKVDGQLLYDYILNNTDGALVAQQLDVGNMYVAGAQALDYFEKYPGRFELLHVKDMLRISGPNDEKTKFESCVLGKGELPLKKILKAARKTAGTTHLVIEQESYQGLGQSQSMGLDLKVIKGWGY